MDVDQVVDTEKLLDVEKKDKKLEVVEEYIFGLKVDKLHYIRDFQEEVSVGLGNPTVYVVDGRGRVIRGRVVEREMSPQVKGTGVAGVAEVAFQRERGRRGNAGQDIGAGRATYQLQR